MLVRFHDQQPVCIFVDPVRIGQVLAILLENATKFTHYGEIELSVEQFLPLDKKGKGKFRFNVRDTGIGIATEKLDEIMQPFAQAEAPATKYYEGAGLGLAIARNLLAMMNSKLIVDSRLGQGCCFSFDLDLEFECPEVESVVDLSFIEKVLIVDYNKSVRNYIEEILQLHDIACDHAKDISEALAALKSGILYDVLLLDHKLSSSTEIPVATQLLSASANSEMEVIVMHTMISQNLSTGIDNERILKSTIQKPVRYQDLIVALSGLPRPNQKPRFENNVPPAENSELRKRPSISILMVEDNLVNMILLKVTLRKLFPDATLIEAGNGLAAVNICRKEFPDIVFMDVQMPIMDGLEATKLIRQINPKNGNSLPIIALTAGNEKDARQKCMDAGMDFFLTKPYTTEDILSVVEKFISV
jgi:CheY-like chemotaxis protein